MAETTKDLTALVHALAASTAWAHAHQQLNDALQPFLGEGLTIEHINDQIDAANTRLAGIGVEIRAAEEHLASVKDRITLETDARKQQVDNDYTAYVGTLDSAKRQREHDLNTLQLKLDGLNDALLNKSKALAELDVQIAEKKRALSDVQSKIANVLATAGSVANGPQ